MNKDGWPAGPGTALLTLEEYERLPEVDGYTEELATGRLVREPRPGARHGVIVGNLFRALDAFVRDRALGRAVIETGFLLAEVPPTVRGADIAFISAGRLPVGPVPEGFWRLAPDLAVEVVSPSDSAAEIQEKVLQYLDAGTRTVWVVQPRTRTVEVWRAGADVHLIREEEAIEGGDTLPGWRFDLKCLFDF
jgi:Uma2 family endonuclease